MKRTGGMFAITGPRWDRGRPPPSRAGSRSTGRSGWAAMIARMNPLLRLVLVSIFVATAVAASATDASAIESEVLRLDGQRVEAILKGDLKALERIYADHMVYVHSAGKVDTKQGYLASLAAGNLTYVSLRYDPAPHVVIAGRDTAIVSGRAHIETKNKAGQITKRILTTTTVYVRAGASWQVASYQGTPNP